MPASSKRVKLLEPHVDHAGTDGRKSGRKKRKSSKGGSEPAGRLPKSCGIRRMHMADSIFGLFDAYLAIKRREIGCIVIVVIVASEKRTLL